MNLVVRVVPIEWMVPVLGPTLVWLQANRLPILLLILASRAHISVESFPPSRGSIAFNRSPP